jgi:hypothetical protein
MVSIWLFSLSDWGRQTQAEDGGGREKDEKIGDGVIEAIEGAM